MVVRCEVLLRTVFPLMVLAACRPVPVEVPGSPPEGTPEQVRAEVLRLDSLWFAGYEARDPDLVDRVLATGFTGNAAGVELDKASALARVTTNLWDRYSLDWVDVEVFGPVAVVRAHRTAYRTDGGVERTHRFAYLDVYAWSDAEWRCVSGQSSAISD